MGHTTITIHIDDDDVDDDDDDDGGGGSGELPESDTSVTDTAELSVETLAGMIDDVDALCANKLVDESVKTGVHNRRRSVQSSMLRVETSNDICAWVV